VNDRTELVYTQQQADEHHDRQWHLEARALVLMALAAASVVFVAESVAAGALAAVCIILWLFTAAWRINAFSRAVEEVDRHADTAHRAMMERMIERGWRPARGNVPAGIPSTRAMVA
jgi:hypothetical protein